jgi:hypothetical protein
LGEIKGLTRGVAERERERGRERERKSTYLLKEPSSIGGEGEVAVATT